MSFAVKLDENLGAMGAVFLKAAGFDVATVADQNLLSTPDADLARICATEGRCLVTLDRDFYDPLLQKSVSYLLQKPRFEIVGNVGRFPE